jgi:hypothetical protein
MSSNSQDLVDSYVHEKSIFFAMQRSVLVCFI